MKCEFCGASIKDTSTKCEYCGSIVTPIEKEEVKDANRAMCPKCGSDKIKFNREENTSTINQNSSVKGRRKQVRETAQVTYKTVGMCENCGNTWTISEDKSTIQEKSSAPIWLWILGWICFFPIPLTVLIYRNKSLSNKFKLILITIIWVFVMIFIASGSSDDGGKKNKNKNKNAVTSENIGNTNSENSANADNKADSDDAAADSNGDSTDNKDGESNSNINEDSFSVETKNVKYKGINFMVPVYFDKKSVSGDQLQLYPAKKTEAASLAFSCSFIKCNFNKMKRMIKDIPELYGYAVTNDDITDEKTIKIDGIQGYSINYKVNGAENACMMITGYKTAQNVIFTMLVVDDLTIAENAYVNDYNLMIEKVEISK
ncbi:MAG: hypothetical protein K6G11_02775 [Lachnospiraceae bacterium]|nr:hypothetical protein [Lachnospiraceae bacterium]